MAKVLDEKSGKMVTPAQAKVLAVLDIEWLEYATVGIYTSDAEWFSDRCSSKGFSRPQVHYGSAKALRGFGLVQIYHDYMDGHEIQVRRIEKARV